EITATALIELATDLTASLAMKTRYDRLLDTVRKTIPCEAVALLSFHADRLKPIALQGLSRDTLGRRFVLNDHPRLAQICQSRSAVRFASDCELPDPYDGLLIDREGDLPVHACMGLPLYFDERLLGVLTLDSLTANVFDDISKRTLEVVAALAAATLNTALMIERLESVANHSQQVVSELTQEALERDGGELIGESDSMLKLAREIEIAAPSEFTVLIFGETGVGKELAARMIHRQSNRSNGPLVYVNCAALPENLIESELFGHVRGAFTGAEKTRTGKFALADQGTLFLDEIGELPLAAQSKLLRALQSKEIQPVGQDSVQQVSVRVLAATNRNLPAEVSAGNFRADLYHRLSAYPITMPSLRERKGDISLLAGYFVEQMRRKLGLGQLKLSNALLAVFESYGWPGNVRELEHLVNRSALKAQAKNRYVMTNTTSINARDEEHKIPSKMVVIDIDDCTELLVEVADGAATRPPLAFEAFNPTSELSTESIKGIEPATQACSIRDATNQFQRQLILNTIEQQQGNWAKAARVLQVDRANLSRIAKRLDIQVTKTVL
ncbi:MAG: anaerobic nitric oxide reductase transcription regulator, partial [Oceanospirillaceae bacterium]